VFINREDARDRKEIKEQELLSEESRRSLDHRETERDRERDREAE
jgi:hypothetical protein